MTPWKQSAKSGMWAILLLKIKFQGEDKKRKEGEVIV